MQVGLPVIAGAVGELSLSIKNNKTGITIAPENPTALSNALYELLQQPERLYIMGQLARQTVLTNFSTEHFNKIGLQIFDCMNKFTAS